MLRGYKNIVCGALALGMAGCSSSVKLPTLGGPAPEQPPETSCAGLNAERTRLLAERDDLNNCMRLVLSHGQVNIYWRCGASCRSCAALLIVTGLRS